jgi:hypothetical protein
MCSVPFISLGGLIRNARKGDNTSKQSSYIRGVAPSIESRRGPNKAAFVAIGIFLFFGMTMAVLAGTTLLCPGTSLDRIWVLNRRAHFQLVRLGPRVGLAFLLLGMTLAAAGVGWFQRKRWGWRLAVSIIGIQVLGDLLNLVSGDYLRGVTGVAAAGSLFVYLCRPPVKILFN